ncbi:MAG: hypothetical protein LC657_00580 [Desulfobacteraceae bacterium]|nr:hypothetical protein [Desulfobacteraceae bacterium]
MGALAHYLETRGIPTTQISLIKEHTRIIQPPRALWVPFALGRPLGVPGDRGFQLQVIQAALALLEAPKGPVLADFPHDVPEKTDPSEDSPDLPACPVSFAGPVTHETETEKLLAAFEQELSEFRSWYDIGLEKRGYSAVIYFSPDAVLQVFSDFLSGNPLTLEENMSSPASALRFAAQDLTSIYFESVMFRPDMALPDDAAFTRWFWQKTAAGTVLKAVKEKCSASDDKALKMTGDMLLVPLGQA